MKNITKTNKTQLFIITSNYKYFFELNRALKRLKIRFKIVAFNDPLPNPPSLILTTSEEVQKIKNLKKEHIVLPFDDSKEDFDKYVFDILKIYNCGAEIHSQLLFSIDPGDTIGLAVFLDGTFFYSQTFFAKTNLISNIKKCVEKIDEEDHKNEIQLLFKVGRGVLPLTLELINTIYDTFYKKESLIVNIVNESKSSKVKFQKFFTNFSKHEISALILALRKGIKVNKHTYHNFFELRRNKEIKERLEKELDEISFLMKEQELLKSLLFDLVHCRITLDDAFKIIEEKKAVSTLTYD
ncbi:MAG: hypothetical protein BAJALOKI1v1_2080003 [Promethearchaeota archaeon]|nr:MAG: hypothetical protein BAJALOKI1v1_2080003 [Candidatus Lokiarchaeota archaeon]